MALLSGIVCLAKANGVVNDAFVAFDKALSEGRVPASGRVTDRIVRSAFASLGRSPIKLSIESVPNPLPAPHNLSWYFSSCVCPDEVRQFATMLGRGHIRVWSVARSIEGWFVLAQVFGEDSKESATKSVLLETRVATKRLKNHALAAVAPFDLDPKTVEGFMHKHAKAMLSKHGVGTFVELFLERRAK